MPEQASLLLRVAQLSNDAIGSYQWLAEERGSSPQPSQLRARALARLAQSNLFRNDARVRRFLLSTALDSNDVREEALVAFSVAEVFQGSPEAASARPLLDRWLKQSLVQLSGPPDPNALELLLLQINYLGAYAGKYGLDHDRPALPQHGFFMRSALVVDR